MQRQINHKVKDLKAYILQLLHEVMEPQIWTEFATSIEDDDRQNYKIYDNDLPSIRDLKALMNMMTAIERATERYALFAVSIVKTLELPRDALEFRRNYKIYMATNSPLTHYLNYAKSATLVALPKIIAKLSDLYALCTSNNFIKAAEFFIEQIISLEQYQEKYLKSKRLQQDKKPEEKEHREGFVTTLVRNNEYYLKKIYKDKYPIHFPHETKVELKENDKSKEKICDYYLESDKDSDTIKHLKKLSNGLIGIKKVLDDYEGYKQAGMIYSISWMATFVLDLRRSYNYFQEFDYEAIIAEQANPSAEYIKKQLQQLHHSLEKIACIADQFESERCFKEGTLLKYVDLLITRYDQITNELKIPIDYAQQKRIYYHSRQQARQNQLQEIDYQLNVLRNLVTYHQDAVSDLPDNINQALQNYLTTYNDDICMDHGRLSKYQQYLIDAMNQGISFKNLIMTPFEYLANRLGLTLHHEVMQTLKKQILSLEKQRALLVEKLARANKYNEENPYDNFNLCEVQAGNHQKLILSALNKRVAELATEKENLFMSNSSPKETSEKKEVKDKPKPVIMSERLTNQLISKVRELGIFSLAAEKFEKEPNYAQQLETLRKEEILTPKSIILLSEIDEILKLPEKKLA